MKKILSMLFYIGLLYFFIALYNKTYDPMLFSQESIGIFACVTFFILMVHND